MKRFLPLALLALVLSGCTIRFSLNLQVNEDESGTFSMFVGLDEEMQSVIEEISEGDASFIDELETGVPEGFEFEEYAEGDFQGARITTGFDSLDELDQKLAEAGGDPEDLGTSLVGGVGVTHDGDEFRFNAAVGDLSEGLTESLTAGGSDDTVSEIDPSLLAGLVDLRYRLTLPGDLAEHNADQVVGGQLVWLLDPFDDTRTELYATSRISPAWRLLQTVQSIDAMVSIDREESGAFTLVFESVPGADQFDFTGDMAGAAGWEVVDAGASNTVEIQTRFESASDLQRQIRALDQRAVGQIAGVIDRIDVEVAEGQMHVELVVDQIDPLLAAALGAESQTTMQMQLALPEDIASSNGRVDDVGTVFWDVGPSDSGATYAAIADIGSSWWPWLLAIAAVIVVFAAVVLGWTARRRRRRSAEPAAAPM